jgi:hypothetical protein
MSFEILYTIKRECANVVELLPHAYISETGFHVEVEGGGVVRPPNTVLPCFLINKDVKRLKKRVTLNGAVLQETTDYLHSKYVLLKLSRISKDFE